MKPAKLKQIARVRGEVALLRRNAHVDLCLCCSADLDTIEENADSPCADAWLRQVVKRIGLAASQTRERST